MPMPRPPPEACNTQGPQKIFIEHVRFFVPAALLRACSSKRWPLIQGIVELRKAFPSPCRR